MKKLFAFLAASLIAVSMVPAVSAAESTSSDNTVYYYVDREGAMYELSEDQYTEVMTEDNLEMVVARDEVTPVSSMMSAKLKQHQIKKRVIQEDGLLRMSLFEMVIS